MYIFFNIKKRKTRAILLSAMLLCGVSVGIFASLAGELLSSGEEEAVSARGDQTVNWGLAFPEPGKTPTGNATADELRKTNAFYVDGKAAEKNRKVLYLTFDSGYENGYTAQILDTLKEKHVSAAFFLVGTYIRDNPKLVLRMVKEGHTVGNHTMNHPDMSAISEKKRFKEELQGVEECYRDVVGKKMKKFYRPPQGKFCWANLEQAKELGYKTVFWSLAYVDWLSDKQPTHEEAREKLLPRTHCGAIILLHSTSKTNAEMLGTLIEEWRSKGYKFASLDAL